MPGRTVLVKPARKLLTTPRITIRARKIRPVTPSQLPLVALVPGLNQPESRIYYALRELRLNFQMQVNAFGGSILGGGRADFLLPDYLIDLEYQGPFHGTAEGSARDVLRNISFEALGYRVETLYERDLFRLKPRLLEIIGRPIVV